MVFVRDWGPKQCKDAIAGRLHDVAVVAAARIDHELEGGIDDGARLLRVEVLLKFGRAFDIREQRGDGLAFAFDNFRSWGVGYSNRRFIRFLRRRNWNRR